MEDEFEDHSHTIIHIDLDCFYAQVEMLKNPILYNEPLGIQQKNIVVTSNYVAREYGIKKCMLVADALRICPNLILVKGEDLHDYRKVSYQVTTFLQQYSHMVERLGLDENYVDVSNIVEERLQKCVGDVNVEGHLFDETSEICQCGCQERLKVGSLIAQEIRDNIKIQFRLTTCAGIAHNKLLAKLVCAKHKPNQQTTIFPNSALSLMLSLQNLSDIPGIGNATTEILNSLNIKTIEDLQNYPFESLKLALNTEKAKWLLNLSFGKDDSAVKPSGKPQSIGLEDSCKLLNAETEIKDKFHKLLTRLLILVVEDGRIPTTIKVTIRKFDSINNVSHRETRQCNISPNLFTLKKDTNEVCLNEQSEQKILTVIMHLFKKLVNISQSYHITLLGLSFTKFKERNNGKNSVASYFVKDVSVQSITSIENTEDTQDVTLNLPTTSQTTYNTDGPETEIEPLPKKSRCGLVIGKHRSSDDTEDLSPSKLRVANLRLNSRDSDQMEDSNGNTSTISNNDENAQCPPDADKDVFQQLPCDVQRELWEDWKRRRNQNETVNVPVKKTKTNTLLNYFVKQ